MEYSLSHQHTLMKVAFFCLIASILLWVIFLPAEKLFGSERELRRACIPGIQCARLPDPGQQLAMLFLGNQQQSPRRVGHVKVTLPTMQCNSTEHWTGDCHLKCGSGAAGGAANRSAVPRIAHFVHIGGPLRFQHWLAVMSAIKFIPAEQVIVYYLGDLTSCWSKKLQIHPLVYFQPMTQSHFPTKVRKWTLLHVPHQTDFVRLSALWQHGGVYIDFDGILTKSFLPLLNYEGVFSIQRDQDIGNGLLVARRHSCFICAYAQSACNNFNGSWDAHSILSLSALIRKPQSTDITKGIKLLNYSEGFFPFSWQKKFLVQMFDTDMKNITFQLTDVYAVHLFASSLKLRLNVTLTWDWMMRSSSLIAAAMRNALPVSLKAQPAMPSQSLSPCPVNAATEEWDDAEIKDVM